MKLKNLVVLLCAVLCLANCSRKEKDRLLTGQSGILTSGESSSLQVMLECVSISAQATNAVLSSGGGSSSAPGKVESNVWGVPPYEDFTDNGDGSYTPPDPGLEFRKYLSVKIFFKNAANQTITWAAGSPASERSEIHDPANWSGGQVPDHYDIVSSGAIGAVELQQTTTGDGYAPLLGSPSEENPRDMDGTGTLTYGVNTITCTIENMHITDTEFTGTFIYVMNEYAATLTLKIANSVKILEGTVTKNGVYAGTISINFETGSGTYTDSSGVVYTS